MGPKKSKCDIPGGTTQGHGCFKKLETISEQENTRNMEIFKKNITFLLSRKRANNKNLKNRNIYNCYEKGKNVLCFAWRKLQF
jgi:hypothetical protein